MSSALQTFAHSIPELVSLDAVVNLAAISNDPVGALLTPADLVLAAGLNFQLGALLGTDVIDESSGEAGRGRPRPADSPDSPAPTKPTASSGGSPSSPLLRSTSPEAARSSSTQKSRLQ
jgi:hypothetical protein